MTYSLIRSDSPEIRLNSREQSSNKFSVLFMIAALLLMIMPFISTSKGVWLSGIFLELQWNCLGWQSAVLLLASFLTGFQGKFSKISRFEVILIGVLGTYLINFLRLFIVGFFAVFVGSRAVGIFHDWFSLNFVLIWFFVFWWFSYSFVLETKDAD